MEQAESRIVATMEPTAQDFIEVNNLKRYFSIRKGVFSRVSGYVKAVDGVSFGIKKGEIFGLVGESGCRRRPAAA